MDGLLARPDGAEVWWDAELAGAGVDGAGVDGAGVDGAGVDGAGTDGAVVLVPPGGRNAAIWPAWFRARCAALAPAVVRLDLRGQGRSRPSPTTPTTVAALVDDVLAVCEATAAIAPRAAGRVHLVGAGLGGVVTAATAIARPDVVAGLTLVATTGWYLDPTLAGVSEPAVVGLVRHERGDPERHRRAIRREVTLLSGQADGHDEGELDAWFAHGLQASDDHRGVLLRAPALWGALATLSVPTTVVHGTRDPLLPIDHGHRLAGTIPGARLLACDGSGHHLDRLLLTSVLSVVQAAVGAGQNRDQPAAPH